MFDPEMPPTDGDMDVNAGAPAVMPPAPVNMPDRVPLMALAMPDDGEQMATPAVGDLVNYQVTGRITSIEGEQAIVQRDSVNGQPLEPDADDAGGPSDGDADNIDQLTSDATEMSQPPMM